MRAAPAAKGSGVASTPGRRLLAAALLGVLLGGCAAGKASPNAQGVTSADASTPAYTNGAAASTPGDPPSVQAPPERVFTGQAVGVITLRDLTMTSGAQGYALGAIQQSTVIAETADGGASWSAVGLSLPELLPGDRTTVVGFGQPGGLPGPEGAVVALAGSSTVWVSTDRFAKWHSVTLPAPVLAAAAYPQGPGGSAGVSAPLGAASAAPIWIVAGPLPAASGSSGQPGGPAGSVGLFELNPLTSKVAFQGELLDANRERGAQLGSARIVRVDSSLAYAFVSKQTSTGFAGALVETSNSGTSWTPLGDPCGGLDFEVRLSAPSPGVVWVGCGSEPSTGNQLKAVYRSDDAGASWRKVWEGVVYQGKTLDEGYMSSLVAVNSMQAYIGLGRGPLLQTFDGGATWMTAVPEIGGSGGVQDVDALSSEQAWALIGGGRMWRTTDGTSWSQVRSAG